jgi:hypothetical protein
MFPSLPYPASNYHICPCCSTEFGNDDGYFTHQQLREMWVENGANWFFGEPPAHWNPWMQLIDAGFGEYIPNSFRHLRVQADSTDASARISIDRLTPAQFTLAQNFQTYETVAA